MLGQWIATRYLALFVLALMCSSPASSQTFSRAECERAIADAATNDIVRIVFEAKLKALEAAGQLNGDGWSKTRNLSFAICDNKASYDTFLVYGKGVIFDFQMIAFLFAQSRALIIGRYISEGPKQFDVYEDLVKNFVEQGESLTSGPIEIIRRKVLALGKTNEFWVGTLEEAEFQRREQTFFLQALYFLSMHERCHAALDHGGEIAKLGSVPPEEKRKTLHQLELDADHCALEIINKDEKQFKGSPVSFFGAMMVMATQAIVYNHPKLRSERSHPSPRLRLTVAKDTTLKFIAAAGSPVANSYATTIEGTYAFFEQLLLALEATK